MNNYPTHYPKDCPPNNAVPVSGDTYRFTDRAIPKEKDFKSYYELGREDTCQARGLSVYITLEDCIIAAKAVPALKRKHIAKAELLQNHGVIAPTPSKNNYNHNTFWSLVNAQDLSLLFHSVSKMGDTNV